MIQLPGVGSASDPTHLSDKDAALAVVSDVAQEIDPVVGMRVLRKIDRYFMPAMLIGKEENELIESHCDLMISIQVMASFTMTR